MAIAKKKVISKKLVKKGTDKKAYDNYVKALERKLTKLGVDDPKKQAKAMGEMYKHHFRIYK